MTDKIRIPLVVEGFGQVETKLNGLANLLAKTESAAKTSAAGTASHFSKVSSEMEKVGMSTAQMNAALRGVPAQFTDIITSLAAGQSPLMVFMQQGGQLKDMFGGAGAAANAMSGYVLGMFNLVTASSAAGVAAVGALGYAYYQAGEEAKAMSKAVIMTGGAVGLSISQISEKTVAVTHTTGSAYGKVTEVMTGLIATGNVAAGALNKASEASIYLEKSGVQAVDETVKQFSELGKSPVEASAKLNDQYHYLTASVYQQIKALENQGKTTAAATLAQNTFADAMTQRSKDVIADLGSLETAWNKVSSSAKSGWDAMLSVGRQGSLKEQLDAAREKLASGGGFFGNSDGARSEVAVLEALLAAEEKITKEKTAKNKKEQAGFKWDREGEAFLSNQKRMETEIAKAKQLGLDAGIKETEIRKRLAEIRKKYVGGDDKSLLDVGMNSSIKAAKQNAKDALDEIDSLFKRKEIGIDESLARKYSTNAGALGGEYSAISARLEKGGMEPSQKLGLMERQRDILREITLLEKQYQRDLEETNTRPSELINEYQRQNRVMIERIDREAELALMTERQRIVAEALYRVEDDGAKVRNDIIKNMPDGIAKTKALADAEEELAEQLDRVADATARSYDAQRSFEFGWTKAFQRYQAEASNAAAMAESLFTRATDGMADALTKFATTGKMNFRSLADSVIEDMIRMQIRAQMAQVTASAGNWLQGIFSSGQAGSGGPQTASEASVGADINSAGMGGFAKGGAFGSSGLHAFAKGGTFTNKIFSEPTFFKFANGSKFGVMGEAGDEAVMPLSRDSSGRLGVRAQGAGKTSDLGLQNLKVELINNGTPQKSDDVSARFDAVKGWVIQIFTSDIDTEGPMAQKIQGQYGVNRAAGAY